MKFIPNQCFISRNSLLFLITILFTYLISHFFSIQTGKLATNELPLTDVQDESNSTDSNSTSIFNHATISEDEETDSSNASSEPQNNHPSNNEKKYTWRIDLSKSEQYWPGWFENLSSKFLNLYVPKLLLLASIDGLDRALTVGQMQGKFQLQVLARCGHAVHEVTESSSFYSNIFKVLFNE